MYVISYDVSIDRVRNKIAKELENYGRRVQYSVFECNISEKQFHTLYQKLVSLMEKEEEGNVRIYKLCAKCDKNIRTIGLENQNMTLEEEELFII